MMTNRAFTILLLLLLPIYGIAQRINGSLFLYQMDVLHINPAFAGNIGAPYFDASYFGNFSAGTVVSRSALLSIHGPSVRNEKNGIGGIFQFYKSAQFGELNIRPSFSKKYSIGEGNLAIGFSLGINYFDFDDDGLGAIPESFGSFEGGLGIYFLKDRFFLGLAAPNLLEASVFAEEGSIYYIPRERHFNFHAGYIFRILDNINLRPSTLLRFANLYELPKNSNGGFVDQNFLSGDFQATFIIDGTWQVGLLYGYADYQHREDINRIGISATFMLGQFHIGYAIQRNGGEKTAIELPVSHIINAGYIFFNPEDRKPVLSF